MVWGWDPAPILAAPRLMTDLTRLGSDSITSASAWRAATSSSARQLLDERGMPHGEVTDLGDAFGLYILAFRDPDNIQLELTAAYG